MWELQFQSLVQEDHLDKEMATHASIFAWKIPWAEELGGLESMGSQRVVHDSTCTSTILLKVTNGQLEVQKKNFFLKERN